MSLYICDPCIGSQDIKCTTREDLRTAVDKITSIPLLKRPVAEDIILTVIWYCSTLGYSFSGVDVNVFVNRCTVAC